MLKKINFSAACFAIVMTILLLLRLGKSDTIDVIFYIVAILGFGVAAIIPLFDKKQK
jgi:hypothetical protein